MYFGDHGVPHFHVISNGEEASISLESFALFAGRCEAKALAQAIKWARENRALLMEKWAEFHQED